MGNIYLVGFMATGKTVVGRKLAERKAREFVDLDDLIERREKQSIADVFAQKGEAYFRQAESAVLAETAKKDNLIVACGGGIVINKDNVDVMKASGKIICLTADVDVLLKRSAGLSHRPLLNIDNPRKRIESLLKERAPFYESADETIDTSGLSIGEVVTKIYECV